MLLQELERGRNHLTYIMTIKFQNWQELPWFLCVLAHLNEDRARLGATQVLEKFDACSTAAANHRLTLKFCQPGALRDQLELFSAGERRSALEPLYSEICKLRFIPLTERDIEAPHSLVFRNTLHRHHGPVSISSSIRQVDICKTYLTCNESFEELSVQAGITNSLRNIPDHLGLSRHHWWQGLPRHATSSQRIACLTWIIYRCDEGSHFMDLAAVVDSDNHAKKKRRTEEKKTLPKKTLKLSFENVIGSAASQHFRQSAKLDDVFSMLRVNTASPQQQPIVVGLQQHMGTPAAVGNTATDIGFEADTGGDVLMEKHEEAPDAAAKIFFRIVHLRPSLQKLQRRPTAAGRKLAAPDIAIQVIDDASSVSGSEREVALSVGPVQVDKTVLVRNFGGDLAWLRASIKSHAESTVATYRFQGSCFVWVGGVGATRFVMLAMYATTQRNTTLSISEHTSPRL